MRKHFDLVLKTPLGNVKEFMRHFNIFYTSYFQRRHKKVGHLYQGRNKAFVIDEDSYLQEATRYLHLNPVRVKGKEDSVAKEKRRYLERYPWSGDLYYSEPFHIFKPVGIVQDLIVHDFSKRTILNSRGPIRETHSAR